MADPADRIPPQDLQAEQAVLGCALIDAGAADRALAILRPDDWYRDVHRELFAAVATLRANGEPVDTLTMQNILASRQRLEAVGGNPYLFQLMNVVPTAANVDYYCRLVADKAVLRRVQLAARTIAEQATAPDADPICVAATAERLMMDATARRAAGGGPAPASEFSPAMLARMRERKGGKGEPAISTGFGDLDRMTGGWQRRTLGIIGARSGMGKSALMATFALKALRRCGVLVFSLEMSREQLWARMIGAETQLPHNDVHMGRLLGGELAMVDAASRWMEERPLYIDDDADLAVSDVRSRSRRVAAECDLGLVMIDYLGLLRDAGEMRNLVAALGNAVRDLRGIAKELHCTVILLVQCNRGPDMRDDKRPQLSDLRDSGHIEAHADIVLMPHRPHYYERKEPGDAPEECEAAALYVTKQRSGPTGVVPLWFFPKQTRFASQDATDENSPARYVPAGVSREEATDAFGDD